MKNNLSKGQEYRELSQPEKRRYAQGRSRVDCGVWGFKMNRFQTLHLTTREGDSNSVKRFTKDFRKLIKWMRSLGFVLEYCCILGLTHDKRLLHMHGLLRLKGGFFKLYEGLPKDRKKKWKDKKGKWHNAHVDANRKALGDKWNEIHNAFSVDNQPLFNKKSMQGYVVSHMMKDYVLSQGIRNKFLVSKSWLPEGIKELMKEFKTWWKEGTGEIWMGKLGWKMWNVLQQRCCEGENTIIKKDFGYIIIDGFRVREAVLYEVEEVEEF